jgi:preprotein translocase subunit YajC
MDTNYSLVVLAVIIAVCLVIFLVLRNKKDRKKFEENVNQPDVPPEKHEDPEGKT